MSSNLVPWSTHVLPIPRTSIRMEQPAKPLHVLIEESRQPQGAESISRGIPNQMVVAQWLAGTSDISPKDKYAPPSGTNGVPVNSMLAPISGGLYNGHGAAKPNTVPYQGNTSFYGNKPPASTVQPVQGSGSHPSSPRQLNPGAAQSNTNRRRSSGGDNQIVSYLQIPASINDSKGSLAEFAAQITCLFWFESSFTLHRVEESQTTPTPTEPLVLEAIPTMGFRKWVTTMLSTTQVTQNVILLALMFIYRLKKLNPTVKGRQGSEFRLLTVALMLGNKFLDDNTYTNKTWAEVSGISVQEIHIMEVEFLSNMRYTLFTSESEWALWHQQLRRFWEYFDMASRPPPPYSSSTATLTGTLSLPSPPPSLQTSPPVPQRTSTGFNQLHPLSMPPYLAPSIHSPVPRMHAVDLKPTSRKRSYDDQSEEQSAKKIARSFSSSNVLLPTSRISPSTLPAPSNLSSYVPRLPIPNLSISTNGPSNMFSGSYSAHLPPPTGRSMSIVYPATQQNPGNLLTPTQPSGSTGSFGTLPPLNDPYRQPTDGGSQSTSPTAGSFPQNSQELHSPAFPLMRNSPYRPLRGVNTLLVPPPSASLHNPSQNVGYNNMRYQPLGKPPSERKTGVVPYMTQEPHQQLPHMLQWPYLPQPTFLAPNFRA